MLAAFDRYLNRMCFRCTPFGMFATASYATLRSSRSAWTLDEAASRAGIERTVRIDGKALGALCNKLERQPVRASRYAVNASLYVVGEKYRFVDWSDLPGTARAFELAEIDRHPLVDALVEAMGQSSLDVDALESLLRELAAPDEIDQAALVGDLVDAHVLVPAISLDPLNADPARALAAALAAHPQHGRIDKDLLHLDLALRAVPPVAAVEHYMQMDARISELTGAATPGTAIRVDAFRADDGMAIDAAQVEAAIDAIDYLSDRFSIRHNPLDAFCEAFSRRYGGGAVPLMEALDPEAGIGYGNAATDKLLDQLGIRRRADRRSSIRLSPFDDWLLDRIQRDPLSLCSREIAFTRKDLAHVPLTCKGTDGPGMHALLRFPAMRDADGTRSRTTVLGGLDGAGALQLISRFCHGDPRLLAAARESARETESESGNGLVHAEIAYLPGGRAANVLARPPLWTYRINLIEPAAEPGEFDLPVSDLMLTVEGRDAMLWSRRLGKRVIPHLTSAHNPEQPGNLAVYRFLCALQTHGTRALAFNWGPMFQSFEYRPRLRFEQLVLAPARWHLRAASLAELGAMPVAEQAAALSTLLRDRHAPRRIELEEGDNSLLLDLDDSFDLEQLLRVARKGRELVFSEVLDDVDDDGLIDGQATWRNEIVVPLHRPVRFPQVPAPVLQRDLPQLPLAQALYVKLYGGPEVLDTRMLPLAVEWVAAQRRAGAIVNWFFIRYADPDWHLRLRVFPVPGQHLRVLEQLIGLAEQSQQKGLLSRFELTAYEREMARYGGPEHIERNEMLFCIDSDLAAQILDANIFGSARPSRWLIALVTIDALLRDFGLTLAERLRLMTNLAAGFKEEFALGKQATVRLGDLYRQHADEIIAALTMSVGAPRWASQLRALCDGASERRRSLALPMLGADPLAQPALGIVSSQVHMLCNRLFAGHGREYEVLVYDFLARAYRSLLAFEREPSAIK
jgi:thiopeptide-type bacteriocin biosynthesis protein